MVFIFHTYLLIEFPRQTQFGGPVEGPNRPDDVTGSADAGISENIFTKNYTDIRLKFN